MGMKALELFCGIGGFAATVAGSGIEIVGALDHDRAALDVYRLNFPDHCAQKRDLEKITDTELAGFEADLWWLSPPCQPYCTRGARRDLDDPRAKSLARVTDILSSLDECNLPLHIALENVEGFHRSRARARLLGLLASRGYRLLERVLCPTQLGVPSRRPRYYLTASRLPFNPTSPIHSDVTRPLGDYLEAKPSSSFLEPLILPDHLLARFGKGLRILDPGDRAAYTTCFTSGYGKSVMRAGSYLKCDEGARYFSPEEIARLLHFPSALRFPEGMTLRRRWHLLGNSLSVVAVREVLGVFKGVFPGR